MKNIKIYQIKEENLTKYGFMDYEFAKEHGFDLNDYKLVAEFKIEEKEDIFNTLNEIFRKGNDGTLTGKYNMRSLSVSDIIFIDEKYYYIDLFGFKLVKFWEELIMKKKEEMTREERLLRQIICDIRNEYIGGIENSILDNDENTLKELYPNGYPTREDVIKYIYNEVMCGNNEVLRSPQQPIALEKKHIKFMGEKFVKELIEDRIDYDIKHNGWSWL